MWDIATLAQPCVMVRWLLNLFVHAYFCRFVYKIFHPLMYKCIHKYQIYPKSSHRKHLVVFWHQMWLCQCGTLSLENLHKDFPLRLASHVTCITSFRTKLLWTQEIPRGKTINYKSKESLVVQPCHQEQNIQIFWSSKYKTEITVLFLNSLHNSNKF